MSDDENEINEAFEAVINGAAMADAEDNERWIEAFTEDIEHHLNNGDVVIDVYEHPTEGDQYVGVPSEVMVELLKYLNEFVEFNHEVGHQVEVGNAAVLLGPLLNIVQEKSASVKSAFIMMALVKHNERQMQKMTENFVREIIGEAWL